MRVIPHFKISLSFFKTYLKSFLLLWICLSSVLLFSCQSNTSGVDNKEIVLKNTLNTLSVKTDYSINSVKHTSFFFETSYIKGIENMFFDGQGVPIMENGDYFPTSVAQIGVKAYNGYKKTGSEESKKMFLAQAKWAKDNFVDHGDYGFWVFKIPIPEYYLTKPWSSAISQGYLISLCLSAYEETKDNAYAIIVEKALKGYLIPLENGGFSRPWDKNEVWFEEYSTERPSRVLNGCIFSLAGAYQVYRATGNKLALQIFNSGALTVKNHLHDYNAAYCSRYNLADWKNESIQGHYQELHVLQLLWLYAITEDEEFKKYATLFLESDLGDFSPREEYVLPSKYKEITSKNCIDCENYGTQNLTNNIWAYGNFWSSNNNAELIIDFGSIRKNIYGLTLYHVSKVSSEIDFDLYAFNDETGEWQLKQKFIPKQIKDKVCAYNITDTYETFIEYYKVFEDVTTSKIKLVFDADNDHIIAFRDINVLYDRDNEIEDLLGKVKQEIKKAYGDQGN